VKLKAVAATLVHKTQGPPSAGAIRRLVRGLGEATALLRHSGRMTVLGQGRRGDGDHHAVGAGPSRVNVSGSMAGGDADNRDADGDDAVKPFDMAVMIRVRIDAPDCAKDRHSPPDARCLLAARTPIRFGHVRAGARLAT